MKKRNAFLVFSIFILCSLCMQSISLAAIVNKRDMAWPVPASNRLSSCFLDGRAHHAIDISAPKGTSVVASYSGTVTSARSCPHSAACGCNGGLGKTITITHNYHGATYSTRYSHLNSINVSLNSYVSIGQQIGTVGTTGRSTGYHLDFQLKEGARIVDPLGERVLNKPANLNANAATTKCCYEYVDMINQMYSVGADTAKPTISNVRVTSYDRDGYTVECNVADNVGVVRVQFPTWTNGGGQNDIIWLNGTISGNTARCRVNVQNFNYKEDSYITHIYAWDSAGNTSDSAGTSCYIDRTPPVLNNARVSNVSTSGYTVTCTVTDNRNEIDRVQFPTWTSYNGQDDLVNEWGSNTKVRGSVSGNTATFRVNANDHNYETGEYITHIYAWDKHGNVSASIGVRAQISSTPSPTPVPPIIQPATPTGINAFTTDEKSAKIRWTPVSGAKGYYVYCSDSKSGPFIKVSKALPRSSTVVRPSIIGKKYYYKVTAYTQSGNTITESNMSSYVEIKTGAAPPRQLKATASAKAIKLSWQRAPYSAGYYIYRTDTKKGTYKQIKTLSNSFTLTYTDKTVKPGKQYYYKVISFGLRNGEKYLGKPSAIVSIRAKK